MNLGDWAFNKQIIHTNQIMLELTGPSDVFSTEKHVSQILDHQNGSVLGVRLTQKLWFEYLFNEHTEFTSLIKLRSSS